MESENVVVVHHVAWNKGKMHRAEAAATAIGHKPNSQSTNRLELAIIHIQSQYRWCIVHEFSDKILN